MINTQKSILESKVVKIPIEEYEEDMNSESMKEKKKEILDLFTNFNNLRSEEEFSEMKEYLHELCNRGDTELIKIYLSETIENDSKDLSFKIDKTNKTASLFRINDDQINELIIPRTVKLESIDYLITSISGTSLNLQIIKFAKDSSVKTIYRHAFSFIEEIYIPASLIELKDGWCNYSDLKKIEISPLNDRFIFKDNSYLLGKSDKNKDEFDIFIFARRDIKEISIPSNIIKICQNAFSYCHDLTKVEIAPNSNIQIIDEQAFECSKIEEIYIPSKVTRICKYAFNNCEKLTKIEIPTNSNLETIDEFAFYHTKIKEFYFPASLKELKIRWHDYINLKKIIISPLNDRFIFKDNSYLLGRSDQSKDEFDVLIFARCDIKEISIPSNISKIGDSAFCNCFNLTKVEIPTNSNLQIIDDFAFHKTKIKKIYIPSKVSKIGKFAFCKSLAKVEISPNSNLQIIEHNSFAYSKIKEICIPSKVTKISKKAFHNCRFLKKVEFLPNSNLQVIKEEAFSYTNIGEFHIPSNVSEICEGAFENCYNLMKIEIPTNSKLEIIEKYAFSGSKIKKLYLPMNLKELTENWCFETNNLTKIIISPLNNNFILKNNKYLIGKNENNNEFDNLLFACRDIKKISIPSNIKIISRYAFYNCKDLIKVDISANSNLQLIKEYAFYSTNVKKISIPSKVSKICDCAFQYCENLKKVEIPTNSDLQIIGKYAFSYSNIKEIFIPSKVSQIDYSAFSYCDNLQIIEISEESKLKSFPYNSFYSCKKSIFMIPSSLSKQLININLS